MPRKPNIIGKWKKPPKRAANSVDNSYTSPKQIELQEKRNEALNHRRDRKSFQEIAKAMNASISTVHGWVVDALKEIPRENAEEVLKMTLEELDEMQLAIKPKAKSGELQYQTATLSLMRERNKLMGLYPDTKGSGAGTVTINQDGNGKTTAIEVTFVEPVARDDDED